MRFLDPLRRYKAQFQRGLVQFSARYSLAV